MDLEKIQKQLETLREIGVDGGNNIEEAICKDVKELAVQVVEVLCYEYKKLELFELQVGKESYDLVLAYMSLVDICRRGDNYHGIILSHSRALTVLRAIYEKEENIKVLEHYIKKLDEGQEAIKRNDDSLIIIYMCLGHKLTNNYYNKLEEQQQGVCYLENALDLTIQKYGEYSLETLFVCYDLVLACSWMIHFKDEKMYEKVNKYYEKFKYILEHNQNQGVMLLTKDAEKNMFKVLDWRISIM